MSGVQALLWDLDGVLIDSSASIRACMNAALAACGRPPLTPEQVRPLIGPPLEVGVATLLGLPPSSAEVTEFIAVYRTRYAATCVAETQPAAGLVPVLSTLAERWPMAVATSKAEVYARQILHGLGVAEFFGRGGIFGRTLMLDHEDKAAVIARALDHVGGATRVIMIGDRMYDVHGASRHGIPTIGVLHGAGSREELVTAGARWLVDDLLGLPALLTEIDAAWRCTSHATSSS